MLNKPPVLAVEGVDGTGKNEVLLGIAHRLLRGGNKVVLTNFPQYFFFASYISRILLGYKDHLQPNVSSPEDLFMFRGALFAIDRLIALDMILKFHGQDDDFIFVSDRGPFSNIVTAAFINTALAPEERLTADAIHLGIQILDKMFLSATELRNILCIAGRGEVGKRAKRESLDIYEVNQVQEIATELYALLIDTQIVTRENGRWIDMQTLTNQIFEKISINDQPPYRPAEHSSFLLDCLDSGQLVMAGPRKFWQHYFTNQPLPDELISLLDDWEKIQLSNHLEARRFNKNKKDILKDLEAKIAELIIKHMPYPNPQLVRQDVREAITRLVATYFPHYFTLSTVAHVGGDRTHSTQITKIFNYFIEALMEKES